MAGVAAALRELEVGRLRRHAQPLPRHRIHRSASSWGGAARCASTAPGPRPRILGSIVRSFKAATSKRVHELGYSGAIWQRNYYEHVIRDEAELNRVREYIVANPLQWLFDHENPGRHADGDYDRAWGWLESAL